MSALPQRVSGALEALTVQLNTAAVSGAGSSGGGGGAAVDFDGLLALLLEEHATGESSLIHTYSNAAAVVLSSIDCSYSFLSVRVFSYAS